MINPRFRIGLHFQQCFDFLQTGDEMSKRAKFVLVTWVGPEVSVMKKAKMSTDKALMKDICQVNKSFTGGVIVLNLVKQDTERLLPSAMANLTKLGL